MTNKNSIYLGIGVFTTFLIVSLFNVQRAALDETIFHYPNVLNFYKNGLSGIYNPDYSAANMPLPYIIVAAISKILGPSVVLARIITCIVSVLSFITIAKIFKILKAPSWYALIIVFYPYFFAHSFVFYAMNYGIFFMSVAFLAIIKDKPGYLADLLIGILLSLATLCQQFYIIIPIALQFVRFIFLYKNKQFSKHDILNAFTKGFITLLPLIFPILIFIKWSGLTHPNFRQHSIGFNPSTLVGILFITGLYSIPFLIQSRKIIDLKNLVPSILIAIILVTFFKPIFVDNQGIFLDKQGPGMFTGLTLHCLYFFDKIFSWASVFSMLIFSCFGCMTLIILFKKASSSWDYFLLMSCFFLVLVYVTNTQIGERHILPLMIIHFIMILPAMKLNIAKYYLVIIAIPGIAYFIFFEFYKTFN